MPLRLPSLNAAIVCDGKELEAYDVKQEGTSSLSAFIASEAGKMRALFPPGLTAADTNRFATQQFKITYSNNLTNSEVAIFLHIDGRLVESVYSRAGSSGKFLGPYKSACSIRPFKFQELQLVGTVLSIFLDVCRKTQTWKMYPSHPKWGR